MAKILAGVSLPNTDDFDFAPDGLDDAADRPLAFQELTLSLITTNLPGKKINNNNMTNNSKSR
jgi:hypothetical protein